MISFMILKGCSAAIGKMDYHGARQEAGKERTVLSEPRINVMMAWIRVLAVVMKKSGQIWVCTGCRFNRTCNGYGGTVETLSNQGNSWVFSLSNWVNDGIIY